MDFLWCTIMVNDMTESLVFYRDLIGLPVITKFKSGEGSEFVFLGNGDTQIELIYDGNPKDTSEREGISIGFEVDCIDDMLELVREKGIEVHSGPIKPNPNMCFFFVLDPNGVKVQFVERK